MQLCGGVECVQASVERLLWRREGGPVPRHCGAVLPTGSDGLSGGAVYCRVSRIGQLRTISISSPTLPTCRPVVLLAAHPYQQPAQTSPFPLWPVPAVGDRTSPMRRAPRLDHEVWVLAGLGADGKPSRPPPRTAKGHLKPLCRDFVRPAKAPPTRQRSVIKSQARS